MTFLDDMAMHTPTLNTWDQFIWLPSTAVPWTTTQVEQYGYHHRNAINLGAVMPAMEFRVTDEKGTYLCTARGLIFKGSILVYNPTRDEVEWVPACGVAKDLSWAEEGMVVALANFVPCTPKRQTTSQSSGPVTSWPRLMNPLWKMSTRGCRRMTSVSRCRRMMSIYPHPSWRITSVRRWRDGGNQTPKHHLVTRRADKVRPNQR